MQGYKTKNKSERKINMSDRQTITRKIQIIPVGDKEEINRVYDYIRNGMTAQNKAMNLYMSALFTAEIQEISKDDKKELHHLYSRISNSKKGSAYTDDIAFPVGLPTTASLKQKVKNDFSVLMKKGLKYGRVSLINYKLDGPLLIHVDYVRLRKTNPHADNGLYHNYDNHNDFLDALKDGQPEIFIKFANAITFKIVFGNPHKSAEMRSVFKNIFEENYLVQGSSIQFDKTGKKIMLNLSLSIPKQEHKLDENVVCGVDLGINIPAVCGLNNDKYARAYIGKRDDFLNKRTKIDAQRRRLQKSLKYTRGGHGRKEKLAPLEKFRSYEKNFAKTYNHMVSRQIVDFALSHNAKYINIEDLEGYDASMFLLRNWSYYELQQQIIYKAAIHGIEVRKVKAYYTSQRCCCCGEVFEHNRKSQSDFLCQNPKCKNYLQLVNADWNASRNIALSKDFV